MTKQLEDPTLGMAMSPEVRKEKYDRLEKLYKEKDTIEKEVEKRMRAEFGSKNNSGLVLVGSRPANK